MHYKHCSSSESIDAVPDYETLSTYFILELIILQGHSLFYLEFLFLPDIFEVNHHTQAMRTLWSHVHSATISLFLFHYTATSLGLACDQVVVDGSKWNFSDLGGPRSVMHSIDEIVSFKNTTFTIDICQGLVLEERKSGEKLCPFGSRVCAMERITTENTSILERGWPIAGELKEHSGGHMDEKWQILKPSGQEDDIEGLRLEMSGGFLIRDDGKKKSQKAIVDFICDPTRFGNENLLDPEDKYVQPKLKRKKSVQTREPKDDENLDTQSSSLTFIEYNQNLEEFDTLHLSWKTKFACASTIEHKDPAEKHWGIFTWFIIVGFLSTASFLIFGSWMNYYRYGARGLDLLPHSDTIRDIPYLLKDWIRRVLKTIQGGSGSRGGYAAV
ncbi:BgTH12-05475 [Blumeria graminis f. sp. triticale]|uniref:Autophagy-related protein 27 n=1 Tax=Blumeria graminis f. sp. triticale TaxID=1689686 RepID=A0A9W4D9D9_BLUGR|nr:BgTH12-05475 [Blumeria graminis f. sp. triticale]